MVDHVSSVLEIHTHIIREYAEFPGLGVKSNLLTYNRKKRGLENIWWAWASDDAGCQGPKTDTRSYRFHWYLNMVLQVLH